MATEIAMLHDVSKCSACRACMVACKQWKNLPADITPFTGEFQSHKDLSSKTYTLIKMKETEKDGKMNWLFIKFQCMHCGDPGCARTCPTGALQKNAHGPVSYDRSLCIGCKYCETGCPFGVPHVDEVTGKVTKCDLCVDRLENGLVPSCAKICTSDAILFGNREEMVDIARKRLDVLRVNHPGAVLYGVDKGDGIGGTSMMYILTDMPSMFQLPNSPELSPSLPLWTNYVRPGGKILIGAAALAVGGAVVMNTIQGKKSSDDHKEGGKDE